MVPETRVRWRKCVMIIPLNRDRFGQDGYVICPSVPVSVAELRDRMLRRAKVAEGSYAYRLVDDLYAAIFERSLDLKADYETYFSREYESFGEFLRRRMRFPSAVVSPLTKAVDDSSGMYYFRPPYSFLSDEHGLEFLIRLLEDPLTRETS